MIVDRKYKETEVRVAEWSNERVLGFRRWAPHLTVAQIREILAHWENTHHLELLNV